MFPIFNNCIKHAPRDCQYKISMSLVSADLLVTITSAVLATLGLLSIIAIPAAASYALIGIAGTITFIWLVTIVIKEIKNQYCIPTQPPQVPYNPKLDESLKIKE